jgi:hypothetical protein
MLREARSLTAKAHGVAILASAKTAGAASIKIIGVRGRVASIPRRVVGGGVPNYASHLLADAQTPNCIPLFG